MSDNDTLGREDQAKPRVHLGKRIDELGDASPVLATITNKVSRSFREKHKCHFFLAHYVRSVPHFLPRRVRFKQSVGVHLVPFFSLQRGDELG